MFFELGAPVVTRVVESGAVVDSEGYDGEARRRGGGEGVDEEWRGGGVDCYGVGAGEEGDGEGERGC